ncbi:hypothetical protein DPMN_189979 [Dreissena polymorpha]|uniref:Uncharacterized protein n=1 Tax=Dreissena polymorpha TaxID=45954 RepID=A0A9D4ICW0_DREPO|nr:hypothetical protein DPMN_189979 [Dreissena polymorpha]
MSLTYIQHVTLICQAQLPPTRIKSRHSGYSVQHPPVMTRPPGQRVAAWGQTPTPMARPTTTTAEPPEMDDDVSTYAVTDGPWYGTATTQGYFGYNYGAAGGQSGGNSGERVVVEPVGGRLNAQRQQQWQRPASQQQFITGPQRRSTTTTTTTTVEPPEQGEVAASVLSDSPGIGGHCFCTFLQRCPADAQVRPGSCSMLHNMFTTVLRLPTIRCCYRPSIAKQLGL